MTEDQDRAGSGNRWEAGTPAAPETPPGAVAVAEPPAESADSAGSAGPAIPAWRDRARAGLRRHRLTVAASVAGLLLGGLAGFGIGHALADGPDQAGGRVGPGQGFDGGPRGVDRGGDGRGFGQQDGQQDGQGAAQ